MCSCRAFENPGMRCSTIWSSSVITLPEPCTRLKIIAVSSTEVFMPMAAASTRPIYFSSSLPCSTPAARPPAATRVPSPRVIMPPSRAVATWPEMFSTSLALYPRPLSCALAESMLRSRPQPRAAVMPPTAPAAPTAGRVMPLVRLPPTLEILLPMFWKVEPTELHFEVAVPAAEAMRSTKPETPLSAFVESTDMKAVSSPTERAIRHRLLSPKCELIGLLPLYLHECTRSVPNCAITQIYRVRVFLAADSTQLVRTRTRFCGWTQCRHL